MEKQKKLFILLVFLILLGLLAREFMLTPGATFNKKVVILGLDGLSPEILEPMIRQGKLPNFARLKEKGSYRHLSTTNPAQSPVAWAAFATGKNPGQNGVFDFIVRNPGTYGLDLVFSKVEKGRPARVLKAKGFWDYTSPRKIPTVVLACPDTFPPDKIYGKMLSGMGVPDILGTQGTFAFYTTESVNRETDVGGKVFQVKKERSVSGYLVGPRVEKPGGFSENVREPFKLTLQNKSNALVEYQNRTIELEVGRWSGWNEVEFRLDFFRKTRGIFKFYLVSIEPELRFYISPINFDPRRPFFSISSPESYSRELASRIGLYYTQGMPAHFWALNENHLSEQAFLQQVEDVFRERKAMLDLELNRSKGGVLFCYFGDADIVQHMFWRYKDPQHPLHEMNAAPEYKDAIEKCYQRMDNVLGDVLKKLGPEDILLVLSDHGFGTFKRAVHLNSWLRKKGYLALKFQREFSDTDLLQDIDWEHTKAYSVGFGGIYINQRHRESLGIVEPGEETKALKERISEGLEAWVDEKNRLRVVKKIYKQEDIFKGPYAKEAPDLFVGFNPGYRASWQTAIGGVPEGLMEDNLKKWSGDHLFDPATVPGVIFLNRKIILGNPSICDITPTILKATGYSDEEIRGYDFDGKPLF